MRIQRIRLLLVILTANLVTFRKQNCTPKTGTPNLIGPTMEMISSTFILTTDECTWDTGNFVMGCSIGSRGPSLSQCSAHIFHITLDHRLGGSVRGFRLVWCIPVEPGYLLAHSRFYLFLVCDLTQIETNRFAYLLPDDNCRLVFQPTPSIQLSPHPDS